MSAVASEDRRSSSPEDSTHNTFSGRLGIQDLEKKDIFDGTSSSSGSSSSTTCGPNDHSGTCQRSVSSPSGATLPIVLGVVIPISIALILLLWLHRRHVKKLRKEDAEDKHGSLDFGWERKLARADKKKAGKGPAIPEMALRDPKGAVRRGRGISMDYGMSEPYLLPLELHQSKESLHSLSRAMTNAKDDPYRATSFVPDDGSLRSPSSLKGAWDDSSSYTDSVKRKMDGESTKGLIASGAPAGHVAELPSLPVARRLSPGSGANTNTLSPAAAHGEHGSRVSGASSLGMGTDLRASNNYLGQFISSGQQFGGGPVELPSSANEASMQHETVPPNSTSHLPNDAAAASFDFGLPQQPVGESDHQAPTLPIVQVTPSADGHVAQPVQHELDSTPIPAVATRVPHVTGEHNRPQYPVSHEQNDRPRTEPGYATRDQPHPDDKTVPMVRVEESEADDYYEDDEYDVQAYADVLGYDPQLLQLGTRPLPPEDPSENAEQRANRIRSFYKEYFDESSKPGGRASYVDMSDNYIDDYYATAHSSPYNSRGPSMAGPHGPRQRRAMSNNSYTYGAGPGPRRPPPKKRMPPPKALNILPTPHKLQDDSMLPNAMDYAPPQVLRNQRSGTPDSLRGGTRPYSPSTRAYNPLVSSFDDLAMLPSPHALRKSGVFTSLDFAPPRFAGNESGSDSGSIRSHRSGVSRLGQHNIRAGAYRISRIPREVAGTRDELAAALRPRMNMMR